MDDPSDHPSQRPLRFNRATFLAGLAAIVLVGIGVGTGRWSEGSETQGVRVDGPIPDLLGSAAGGGNIPPLPRGTTLGGDRPPLDLSLLSLLSPGRFGRSTADCRPPALSDAPDMRTYNGRPIRRVSVLRMKVTAYSPDERSCGASADGITASGYSVLANGGFLVAADPSVLPLGSLVSVPGYDDGSVVPVLDTGGAIKGNRLDVLYPTHEVAMRWGVQELDVEVWDYADGLPNGFRRVRRPSK